MNNEEINEKIEKKVINKNDLIDELSKELNMSKLSSMNIYMTFLNIIDKHLIEGDKIKLDIGTIYLTKKERHYYKRNKGQKIVSGQPINGHVVEGLSVKITFKSSRYKKYFSDPNSIKPILKSN